jgi:hypothetical protein
LQLKPWEWPAVEPPDMPNAGQSQHQKWHEAAQQIYRDLNQAAAAAAWCDG